MLNRNKNSDKFLKYQDGDRLPESATVSWQGGGREKKENQVKYRSTSQMEHHHCPKLHAW